ncbi:lipid A deacylase LpxR family protein [Pararhodospirillum photometricum]|uniref:lipid A deacylase LpxR family protein n=1 Tax=Pararhodospirillum photometricum TaxID=1084 RepID=UPI00031A4C9A|nr:lipid A deacylase LpxR family protein [Pararhodospirillum photometricum]
MGTKKSFLRKYQNKNPTLWRNSYKKSALLKCVLLTAVGIFTEATAVHAEDNGRLSVVEENDYFSSGGRDQHYTQGIQLDYLSPDLGPDGIALPMKWIASFSPIFSDGKTTTSRKLDFSLAQKLYTPRDTTLNTPDPRDRPYAGWINAGVSLLKDADQKVLDHLQIQIGLVGPGALGRETQNHYHIGINSPISHGWSSQLDNEPTFNLYYDRHYRFSHDLTHALSVEVLPSAGVAVGNVYDYAAMGGRVRVGRNLKVDYGPNRIAPGPTGTAYFNKDNFAPDTLFGWYVSVGVEGRAMAHNMFLNGNSFSSGPSVPMRPLVGDLEGSIAIFYSDWAKLSYSHILRSQEFYTHEDPDNFGSFQLSVGLNF